MLFFISGGSASGKSALAERVCCALPGEHVYIATMPVRSAEDERKVARHHALRAGRGFAATLEMPGRLDAAAVPPDAAVLFECLSTFTANRMFSGEARPAAGWLDALWAERDISYPRREPRTHMSSLGGSARRAGADGNNPAARRRAVFRRVRGSNLYLCHQ